MPDRVVFVIVIVILFLLDVMIGERTYDGTGIQDIEESADKTSTSIW